MRIMRTMVEVLVGKIMMADFYWNWAAVVKDKLHLCHEHECFFMDDAHFSEFEALSKFEEADLLLQGQTQCSCLSLRLPILRERLLQLH